MSSKPTLATPDTRNGEAERLVYAMNTVNYDAQIGLITLRCNERIRTDVLSHDGDNEISSSRNRPNERTLLNGRRNSEKGAEQKERTGNLVVLGNVPVSDGARRTTPVGSWDGWMDGCRSPARSYAVSYPLCSCSRRRSCHNRLQMFRGR